MKAHLIISIAVVILLGSCKTGNNETETILSGTLPDLKNESVTLVPVQDYYPGLTLPDSLPTVQTDSLGKFTFKFSASNATFYQVVHGNFHQLKADIFLEPGDSLFIEQSSWNDEPKFSITGKGSGKLKHLENDYAVFPNDKAFNDKIGSDSFPTEFDFKRFIDSIYWVRVNALTSTEGVPDSLKAFHQNTLRAERANFLLDHLERRNYYMKEEFSFFYPDEQYTRFLDSMSFDNAFAQTTASRMFSKTYLNYIARKAFKSKTDDEWWNDNLGFKLKSVSERPKSLWSDLLALSTIRDYSFGLMTDGFFGDLEQFGSHMKESFYNGQNKRLYESNAAPYKNLAPGKPAPDFALPDSSGKLLRLSDFKGRVVYVDFWGTWCYPCIQEIPDALTLQEKYKDQPVTFLYVALEYDNEDIAGWKQFIAGNNSTFGKLLNNKPFPGVHVVAEKQFRNKAISAYKINFAPTHVLIDQSGNIVHARAKGAKEIHQDIDALLTAGKK